MNPQNTTSARAKKSFIMAMGLPDGRSLSASSRQRKVRSPQGSVPANGRGDPLKADFTESATENIPPGSRRFGDVGSVRVKRCGKSAPRSEQSGRQGKPHAEQDQIGEEEWPAPFDSRVGR